VNHSRVCIELKRGDTLDLGDDNKFLVISLDPADAYDEDEDEADDVDEGKEEGALDRDNEDDKADNKKPPSYPKRRDDEDDEEPYPPTTAEADADAGQDGDADEDHNDPSPPHTSKADAEATVADLAHTYVAKAEVADLANKYNFGKKTAGVMWHLYDKNHGRDGSDGSFHPTFPHQKVARDEGHR
jgi:hypothetical protein